MSASIDPSSETPAQEEVFAEISLFGTSNIGSSESGDCGCFSCDGNPCVKLID